MSAIQAILPLLADKENLITINAINIVTLSRIFGAILAELLLTVASLYALFLVALFAYVILYVFSIYLTVPEIVINKKKTKARFREIFPIISKKRSINMILAISMIPLLFISGFNLFVMEIGKGKADWFIGMLYFIEGANVLLAGMVVKKVFKKYKKQIKVLLVTWGVMGIAQLSLSFSTLYLTAIGFSLFGIAYGIFKPLLYTYFQQKVPPDIHGKFFAFKKMIDRTIMQICLVLIGVSLDMIGYERLMIGLGICMLLGVCVVLFSFKNEEIREEDVSSIS
ncbi:MULTISPECIES: MFS transporter [Priestia]|uniref:MFS transporter n=1 Tax=Priestia TaxID=2800373 RepID=UPI00300370B0